MSAAEALGLWYCELVDQEQSDEEAERLGDYEDYYDRERREASKTEFAQTTLELRDDGTYRIAFASHALDSFGTWTEREGSIELSESSDCTNGYDGLEYAAFDGDRFVVAFKLIPDAHDGLDVLVLTFSRTPPVAKGQKPEGFVPRLLAAADNEELYAAIDEALAEGAPATLARELWDAWLAGSYPAADPESEVYELRMQAFSDDNIRNAGVFTHADAEHALETIDWDDERDFANLILDLLPTLPVDEAADEELASLIGGEWFDELVISRFLRGGAPEELFERRLVPQPATDEASRVHLRSSEFTRFEAIEKLFPPGHPDLPGVLIRYRGPNLLDTSMAMIEARGLADEVLARATAILADHANARRVGTWKNAIVLVLMLLHRAGKPPSPTLIAALDIEPKGMSFGSLTDGEKAQVRAVIADLPDDQRELISQRLYLSTSP